MSGNYDDVLQVVDDLKVIGKCGEQMSGITIFGLQMIIGNSDNEDDVRFVNDLKIIGNSIKGTSGVLGLPL